MSRQPLVHVTQCLPLPDYRLRITCSDGAHGIFDMKPYITQGVYRQLQEPQVFNDVHLVFGVPTWQNGIDIASERVRQELHIA